MYDIITFGSATIDIFLKPKDFEILRGKNFATQKGICFTAGSKIEIEDMLFATGGGGTNTAATFVKQGFKTAYCGSVGNDFAGEEIIGELNAMGVDAKHVIKINGKKTNHSFVLTVLSAREDRTILAYREASEDYSDKDIPWDIFDTKWIYLAPLSGKLCNVFEKIVASAKKRDIKIIANPGMSQLSLPLSRLKKILKNIDVLVLNQEEASFLTKISYQKENSIFRKIDELCDGIAVMTKGEKGVTVSDGKTLYRAKPNKGEKVIDRTGAGDSFGAGFVSGLIQSEGDVEYATQMGIANSTACLKKLGAKNGLLKKGDEFQKVRVEKELCAPGKICKCRIKCI